MDKIRVNNYVKEIEVNDDHETIKLYLADQSIPYKLQKMIKEIEVKINELSSFAEDTANTELLEKEYDFNLWAKAKIDDIFGKDTCRKVFGDIVPPLELYIDFLNELQPYFESYAKNRSQKLNKYSPERIGSAL